MENNYLNGSKIYGDDFTLDQIEQWYNEEKEGYSSIPSDKPSKNNSKYSYDKLNTISGFKYLKTSFFNNVLGFGSAYGHELLPIISKIGNITIVEPSDILKSELIKDKVPKYVKPLVSGDIDFPDNSFQLITCFGTLHHIPNVTHVLNEFYRVCDSSGYVLIREPITSMGDWTKQRKGLTKNERGIPKKYFREIIKTAGFKIIKEQYCFHSLILLFSRKFGVNSFDNTILVYFDRFISFLFGFIYNYHPKNLLQKFQPTNVFYVLKK